MGRKQNHKKNGKLLRTRDNRIRMIPSPAPCFPHCKKFWNNKRTVSTDQDAEVCVEESWVRKCWTDVYHIYCSRAAVSDTRHVSLSQIKLQQGVILSVSTTERQLVEKENRIKRCFIDTQNVIMQLFLDCVRYSQIVRALQPLLGCLENLVDPGMEK